MSDYLIIGGDKRFACLADLLDADTACMEAHRPYSLQKKEEVLDAAADCAAVILPIPYTRDGAYIFSPFSETKLECSELLARLSGAQTLFYGGTAYALPQTQARCVDILADEAYAAQNAGATAQILFRLLVEKYGVSPSNAHVLVLGYGRIAKMLCVILKHKGAAVCVAARREEARDDARRSGLLAMRIDQIESNIKHFDVVVNTVPARILSEAAQQNLPRAALLVDVASRPHCMDFQAARLKNAYLEPGLPGKYRPEAEATAIHNVIMKHKREV